jgi:hypothetical protein
MTLYRQIVISIITLLVLGFLGTVVISTNNLRAFIETQLKAHAQDTATSLGLSISPHMQPQDMALIQSMVDAIFDRGYYSRITITALDGKSLLERTAETDAADIPDWFANAVALQTPTAEALVMSGWKQSARIYVTSNPGNAYNELWSNTVATFWLFLAAAAILIALALLAVKVVLKPLHNVELQASAICNRSYPVQKKLPRTRELRRVVLAMNHLAEKVKEIFSVKKSFPNRQHSPGACANRPTWTRLPDSGTGVTSPASCNHWLSHRKNLPRAPCYFWNSASFPGSMRHQAIRRVMSCWQEQPRY